MVQYSPAPRQEILPAGVDKSQISGASCDRRLFLIHVIPSWGPGWGFSSSCHQTPRQTETLPVPHEGVAVQPAKGKGKDWTSGEVLMRTLEAAHTPSPHIPWPQLSCGFLLAMGAGGQKCVPWQGSHLRAAAPSPGKGA